MLTTNPTNDDARDVVAADDVVPVPATTGSSWAARLGALPSPIKFAVSALVLIVAALVAFWPQVFGGAGFPWDFQGKYTTAPAFVSASIDNGVIPRWAPGTGAGTPILEDVGSGAYYPLWWMTGWFSITLTFNMFAKLQVLHIIAGAMGVVALGRARRIGWTWSTVAAMAFLFNGAFFGESEHANFVRGFAMLPWMLWAVTPPERGRRWHRLIALPMLAYLLAAGGYPGQLISFPLILSVYLGVAWYQRRDELGRRELLAVGAAGLGLVLGFAAVYAGFYLDASNQTRVNPGTAAQRALSAIDAADVLALVLNPFAFEGDGAIRAWALAVPVLLGLAGVSRAILRQHAPLAVAGAGALLLGVLPAWEPAGELMVSLGPLFTSRFPAADYKIGVTLALAMFGTLGWRRLAVERSLAGWKRVAVGGSLVLWGVWLGTVVRGAAATRYEPAIIAAVLAAVALAAVAHRVGVVAVGLVLIVLIAADGMRLRADNVGHFAHGEVPAYVFEYRQADLREARDAAADDLADVLDHAPESRPQRIPPAGDVATRSQGTPVDALGYLAMGYRIQGHGGFQTKSKVDALADSDFSEMLLLPWTAWSVPCPDDGCDALTELPPPDEWTVTDGVRTMSYGTDTIEYEVSLDDPTLIVENELNYAGWTTGDRRVAVVEHDGPFRAWVLQPGDYTFTASFERTTLRNAIILAALAAAATIGCGALLRVRRPSSAVGTGSA